MEVFIHSVLALSFECANRAWFLVMWLVHTFLALTNLVVLTSSAPPGFPSSGNGLWYTAPGKVWSKDYLPVGNGYLGAMLPGGTTTETTQLNIESLWSGGPFEDPSYNGGNKQPSEQAEMARAMQQIRQTIFQSPIGDIDNIEELATDAGAYGSFAGAGYLVSNVQATGAISNYARWLDMEQGLARTIWTQGKNTFLRTTFCSHANKACFEHLTTTSAPRTNTSLPGLSYAFSSTTEIGLPAPNITCVGSDTLSVRGHVTTPTSGMLYELLFRIVVPWSTDSHAIQCIQYPVPFGSPPNATVQVKGNGAREAWITWVGNTDYSIEAGDEAHQFSFRGNDPHEGLVTLLSSSSSKPTFQTVLEEHISSYRALLHDPFTLDLGQKPDLSVPTNKLLSQYRIDEGNAYLEWLTFSFGRYLLASSAPGTLPANLQGIWADGWANPWGAVYHSNINIQMNYWSAEMTNLDVSQSLFNYFEKTWVPRGEYTARVLYNISRGWVTHNEMNIFGHTGMKALGNSAQWANYPEANVWMMIHIWDHFDYTGDVAWWRAQGWPLLKGAAQFHLDKLIPDLHFNDSTLVVNPCNSPEQAPITLGCAHAQQMIWQLFNAVEKGFAASGDPDTAFLEEVRTKRAQMDKGLHIGSWGQLQEWKVEKDSPTDTHRHLSHLIGLYPGYAIASYDPSLQMSGSGRNQSRDEILKAASISLLHRGNGTGSDADSGWEKAWRAAAWAQLGDTDMFYHELTYCLFENFGPNLFSLYNPFDPNPIFQIDANLAYPGAVMNAIIQAPDVPSFDTPLTVTLLPTLPEQWSKGSIKGARLRAGVRLDMDWSEGKPNTATFKVDKSVRESRNVRVVYNAKVVGSFVTGSGVIKSFSSF
ncbi:glycoside hydrolase family 95 protein [Amanita thiersii Skay4041]|uniref:Glycoside hydrolase family 95 protein n=1 Tax=Amanita thiersii Skay4041 TaxID=703135 RepID=A0A2A9NV42_9AGAR|nr:glycoside hydrolase family 95 protein [Amanita thiersii Skay4041]